MILTDSQRLALLAPRPGRLRAVLDIDTYNEIDDQFALVQAWLFLVAAELLAASQGLGYLMTESSNTGRTDRIFLAIICLALLGKLTDAALGLFERWALRRWA